MDAGSAEGQRRRPDRLLCPQRQECEHEPGDGRLPGQDWRYGERLPRHECREPTMDVRIRRRRILQDSQLSVGLVPRNSQWKHDEQRRCQNLCRSRRGPTVVETLASRCNLRNYATRQADGAYRHTQESLHCAPMGRKHARPRLLWFPRAAWRKACSLGYGVRRHRAQHHGSLFHRQQLPRGCHL